MRCVSFSHEKIPGTVPYSLSAMIKSSTLLREVQGETVKNGKEKVYYTQPFIHLTLEASSHFPAESDISHGNYVDDYSIYLDPLL